MKEILKQNSIEFGFAIKQSATRYKQKQKYFSLPDHQLADNILFLVSREGKKRIKVDLYLNLQELQLELFSYKNVH